MDSAEFVPADFDEFRVGDRIMFVTMDNGYGGGGPISRTGTVIRVTKETLRVRCDRNTLGAIAVLRRSDWQAREPRMDVSQELGPLGYQELALLNRAAEFLKWSVSAEEWETLCVARRKLKREMTKALRSA
jgi:hypothetical protein